MFKYEIGQLEW